MEPLTLICDDRTTAIGADLDGGRVLVDPGQLSIATGWALKPEGLCRGAVCVPTSMWPDLVDDGRVDLGVFARLTDQVLVADADERIAALGPSASRRTAEMVTLHAPDFTVDTIDGDPVSLGDFKGRKKLLVAFSSWCGCRYDLPSWEQINRELAPEGLAVIAVAVDEDPDAVRPWVEAAEASFPVLLDRDHVITERFSLVNVPTVIWIDEDDQVVRPNDVAFSDDQFKEFHGIDSEPHLAALRRWVTEGELPLTDAEDVRAHQMPPTDDEQRARLEFRIALELRRDGRADAADVHFDRAIALAPLDFTIRRAVMPLRGQDPFFGEEFLELYQEWEAVGRPYYRPRD
ncbi:MAG: redoxin domain-containing protein [Acidimicrobiales bacterium]